MFNFGTEDMLEKMERMEQSFLDLPAEVLSEPLQSDDKTVVEVHFKTEGAPKKTKVVLDKATYVVGSIIPGETVHILMDYTSNTGLFTEPPAIVAPESFENFFKTANDLRAFRKFSKAMQEDIVHRNFGKKHEVESEETIHFKTTQEMESYFSMTRESFTEDQQLHIEEWLRKATPDDKKKAEILLSISTENPHHMDALSPAQLRSALDKEFYGMERQKEEIVKHIAASQYSEHSGMIICLVGTAGTGKTALARVIGKLLGKPFIHIQCAGITTALDVLGDRTVYNGAYLGKIGEGYYVAKTSDGLVLLDEFDKMPTVENAGKDGNPYNSFLEIFSEKRVSDTYLGTEILCPNTIFICTCNSLDNVPSYIQNRFDAIIHVPAYTDDDLLHIAREHLLPRLMEKYGVPKGKITLTKKGLKRALDYIDDFGARSLSHNLEAIVKEIVATWVLNNKNNQVTVTEETVAEILDKVVGNDNPRVFFRQHIHEYSKEVAEKIIDLEEKLDRPNLGQERKAHYTRQFEYLVKLHADSAPFHFDVDAFEKIVDKKLYGLSREKQLLASIFHELEVKKTNSNKRVLLIGPPGVGKTALFQAVAEACGLPYVRIALNGVDQPSLLIGSSQSYRNADAGIIIKGVYKGGSTRLLIHLDELDKVVNTETQEALLSLLDDSGLFADNFLDGVPVDLRSAIFVATANEYKISPALLSRFTVIEVGSYTREQQETIVRDYLIPDLCSGYQKQIKVSESATKALMKYTNGGGVREIKEKTTRVIRETAFAKRGIKCISISEKDVVNTLGPVPQNRGNRPDNAELPGLSNGLAVLGNGGGMCFSIQTRLVEGSGIDITGLPSEVVKDSVRIAMSVLMADYGMNFSDKKLCIHFAEGAVKKDGPSAGTSILMSIYSAAKGIAIPKKACYTGEIDLFGYVWAVGGIVEKVGAADMAGLEYAYIPKQSYDSLQEEERKQLGDMKIRVVPVQHVREIINDVYGLA